MTNPLIAQPGPVEPLEGAGAVNSVAKTAEELQSGEWVDIGLQGLGAGLDVGAFLADPLAGLFAVGAGWLIEHVSFLREPLDALAGDPESIDAMSQTWQNVSGEVHGAAEELITAVRQDTAPWHGPAIEAYVPFALAQGGVFDAVSKGCQAIGAAVQITGEVVKAVRGIIRDLVSQAVGELCAAVLEWTAAELLTLGTATPAMVADLIRRAVKWGNKIMEWVDKIVTTFRSLYGRLDELGGGIGEVKKVVDQGISKGSGALRRGSAVEGVGELGGAFRLDVNLSPRNDVAKVGFGTVKGLSEDHGEKPRS